jgi:hypothetical protein
MIQAPFNKSSTTPVNFTVVAKSLVNNSGGSGWDNGTIKVKLEKPAE